VNSDYVYVNKNHRSSDPRSNDYMIVSKYYRMMEDLNGLSYDQLAPFHIPSTVNCFRVIDKHKAMIFCLNNGIHISKPEFSATTNPLVCRSS